MEMCTPKVGVSEVRSDWFGSSITNATSLLSICEKSFCTAIVLHDFSHCSPNSSQCLSFEKACFRSCVGFIQTEKFSRLFGEE
jgi:hypothetical protein